MRFDRLLMPLATSLLLWGCGEGDATSTAEDTPLPAEATRGSDEGLPNPDAAQPVTDEAPPQPATPPAATETRLDDPPPEEVAEPVAPTVPDDAGALTPGESVDEPPLPDQADEPTEPM